MFERLPAINKSEATHGLQEDTDVGVAETDATKYSEGAAHYDSPRSSPAVWNWVAQSSRFGGLGLSINRHVSSIRQGVVESLDK